MKGWPTPRHFPGTRTILLIALLLAPVIRADEAQERASIDHVIVALNNPEARGPLFTKDADCAVNFDRLLDLHIRSDWSPIAAGIDEPWRAMTVPRIVSGPIRFRSSRVAVVEGASTIGGAVTFKPSVPLIFVLRKQGGQWRIQSVHLGTEEQAAPAHPRL
jgi:hypothetical protein